MATTSDYYGPYDAGAGANASEDQWRKFMGGTISTGVINGYLNELAVTGDSSGMQVKLATGAAWINGAYGENTAGVVTLAIGASHATLHRYDLIVARNNYTDNVVEWDVIAGTPGASPSIPTVTIDTTKYEIALAYVYIAATVTTITAGNVTDQRSFRGGNNNTITFSAYSSANITASSTPAKVQLANELFDKGSCFDATTNYRFTAPYNGIYHFDGIGKLSTPGDGNNCSVLLYKNGGAFTENNSVGFNVGGANSVSLPVSAYVELDAGDYVELYVTRATGSGNATGNLSGALITRGA